MGVWMALKGAALAKPLHFEVMHEGANAGHGTGQRARRKPLTTAAGHEGPNIGGAQIREVHGVGHLAHVAREEGEEAIQIPVIGSKGCVGQPSLSPQRLQPGGLMLAQSGRGDDQR